MDETRNIFMEKNLYDTAVNYNQIKENGIKFQRGKKSKSIFHYTSINGLQGILNSKTLRFTNIKYMNDKDEIIAGLDSMAKACDASEEERSRLLSAFTKHGTQTFVCCFSLEEDSLPMWNYYTKEIHNQGYNIEFDDKKLVESILRNNPVLDGCDFAFGHVDYSKDNDSEYSEIITQEILSSMQLSISKLFLAVVSSSKNNFNESAIKDWEEKIEDTEKKIKLNDLPVYFYNGYKCSFEKSASGNYLYFVKRDFFKQEREFRIVITVPDELLYKMEKEGVYNFCVNNGVLVPYIQLRFSEDVVKSITISPTVQSDLVELSIQDFLTYSKYDVKDFQTFIKHSKVPVRF